MTRQTLENGLTVVYLDLPHVHAATLVFAAHGGPRYESPTTHGLSHVMEHLLFRGTAAHPDSLSFHSAVEALGGEINGQTQRDAVSAHITVPPRATAAAAERLAEVCLEPLMRGLDIEREVILEEILDTRDASGCELDVDTLSRHVLWPDHPMGASICGPIENLHHFTEAQALRWHRRCFVGANAVLVVAGPRPAAELHPTIAASFGRMPRGAPLPSPPAPIPPRWAPVHAQTTDDAQATVLLTFPAPHEKDPRFAALQLLQRVLDDGFGARLRQAICEQRGLAYALSVSLDAYGDCGALDIEISCAPEKVVPALAQTLEVLDEVRRVPVAEAELRRAKTRHQASFEFCLDDPAELCAWVAAAELMGVAESYAQRLDDVLAVGPEALTRVAADTLSPERAILTLVGPVDRTQVSHASRLLGRRPGSAVWWGAPARVMEVAG